MWHGSGDNVKSDLDKESVDKGNKKHVRRIKVSKLSPKTSKDMVKSKGSEVSETKMDYVIRTAR